MTKTITGLIAATMLGSPVLAVGVSLRVIGIASTHRHLPEHSFYGSLAEEADIVTWLPGKMF